MSGTNNVRLKSATRMCVLWAFHAVLSALCLMLFYNPSWFRPVDSSHGWRVCMGLAVAYIPVSTLVCAYQIYKAKILPNRSAAFITIVSLLHAILDAIYGITYHYIWNPSDTNYDKVNPYFVAFFYVSIVACIIAIIPWALMRERVKKLIRAAQAELLLTESLAQLPAVAA